MDTSKNQRESIEGRIAQAETRLIQLDSQLGELIERQRPIVRTPRRDYFAALVRAIVGQQISVAAAAAIYDRLETVTQLEPLNVLNLNDQQIQHIGLSRQKTAYLRDLTRHFVDNPEVYDHLEQASDEAVIQELTAVKGIGVWTAQMFLMFTLVLLDVFAPDDVGLQRAMCRLYGWEEIPDRQTLIATTEAWQPYRTVACWHLWESLHNTPAV